MGPGLISPGQAFIDSDPVDHSRSAHRRDCRRCRHQVRQLQQANAIALHPRIRQEPDNGERPRGGTANFDLQPIPTRQRREPWPLGDQKFLVHASICGTSGIPKQVPKIPLFICPGQRLLRLSFCDNPHPNLKRLCQGQIDGIPRENYRYRMRSKTYPEPTPPELLARLAATAKNETDPIARLIQLRAIEQAVEEARRHAVTEARAKPKSCTWKQIGSTLGVSRQAAHQRYGR